MTIGHTIFTKRASWEISVIILICVSAAFICRWDIDEGCITLFIDAFRKTGELRYLFQHNNAHMSFGWPYFYILRIVQFAPLNPSFYFLSRMPSAIMIGFSAVIVRFFINRQTGNRDWGIAGALLFLLLALTIPLVTSRYDAPYVFGSAAVLLPLAFFRTVPGGGLSLPEARHFTTGFVIALFIATFALCTHPNGIGCYGALGMVWLLGLKHLNRRQNLLIIAAYAVSILLIYKWLLVGRTIPEFLTDLNEVKDASHGFDFIAAIKAEWPKYKGYLSGGLLTYKLITWMVILAGIRIVLRPKILVTQPVYLLFFVEAVFMALQLTKWAFYEGLILAPSVAILFINIDSLLHRFSGLYARHLTPRRLNALRACAAMAAVIVFGCILIPLANQNTLLRRLVGAPYDSQKYAELSVKLKDKRLSQYTDLRVLPLFSFMDISHHYMDSKNLGVDPDAPWNEDGAYAICSEYYNFLSCGQMHNNNHFKEYTLTYVDSMKAFGDEFKIYLLRRTPAK